MVESLSHITFVVRDLDRMRDLLCRVLDAKVVYDSGDQTFSLSKERFFDIGGVWVATMEGNPLPERSYNHVAFKITEDEFDMRLARIRELGLEVREGRSRVQGEGRSIYFYDHDNHLFELHTGTLQDRLARYGAAR